MFTINKENVHHLIQIGKIKHDKDKQRLLKELHFSDGKLTSRANNLLKKIWW